MPYPKDQTKLEKWEKVRAASYAAHPDRWNGYDTDLRVVIATYTRHLIGVASFVPPDWKKIKAMLWVETGPDVKEWKTAPMQIGNPGDAGLRDLLTTVQGKMILPPEYAQTLTLSNAQSSGLLNIQAGIGYLLKRAAIFGVVLDLEGGPARQSALTRSMTMELASYKEKREQKSARKHLAILGWRVMDYAFLAGYNGGGDGNYQDKLQYAYDLMAATPKPENAQ